MDKSSVLTEIKKSGIVAIIRTDSAETSEKAAEACLAGGIKAIEVTFTLSDAPAVISRLAKRHGDKIIIGAGSVLDPETARTAILNGAQYIVSPCLNLNTVKLCNRYGIPCMPGAMTVKEVVEAMEAGADIIKVFPSEVFGPRIIKAFMAPLPQAQLMPTGGVTLDNVHEWFSAGAVAVGVGGSLIAGYKDGKYSQITQNASDYVAKIKATRHDK